MEFDYLPQAVRSAGYVYHAKQTIEAFMNRAATIALLAAAIAFPISTSHAQDQPDTTLQRTEALRVFLDCHTRCDFDHYRRELSVQSPNV